MKKFLVFFLFCSALLVNRSLGQTKIWLKGNADISVSIGLPTTVFRLSDNELHRVKMEVSIVNNSKAEMEVYPSSLFLTTSFGIKDLFWGERGEASLAYKLERFDDDHKKWEEQDVNKLYNDIDFVELPDMTISHKFIKEGEKYQEYREPFSDMNWKAGKYRLQVILGVEVRKDLFAMVSSNELEIEVHN